MLSAVCFLSLGVIFLLLVVVLALRDFLKGVVSIGDGVERCGGVFCSRRADLEEGLGREFFLCEEVIKALRAYLITSSHNIITETF